MYFQADQFVYIIDLKENSIYLKEHGRRFDGKQTPTTRKLESVCGSGAGKKEHRLLKLGL